MIPLHLISVYPRCFRIRLVKGNPVKSRSCTRSRKFLTPRHIYPPLVLQEPGRQPTTRRNEPENLPESGIQTFRVKTPDIRQIAYVYRRKK